MVVKSDIKSNKIEVSIIIIHYKNIQDTLNCLHSIQHNEIALSYEVIVIDNNPQSNDGVLIKEKFPFVCYMKMSYNMGFGRANNLGAQHALGEYLLFFNNDAEITKKTITSTLKKYKLLKNVGLFTCRLIEKHGGSIQYSAFLKFPSLRKYVRANFFTILLYRKNNNIGLQDKKDLDLINSKSGYVPWVTGAFMLCAKSIFDLAGGFDDDYFMYSEDVDLCYRLNKMGYNHYIDIDSEVIHGVGKSFKDNSNRMKQIFASECLFLRKNRGSLYFILVVLIFKFNYFADIVIAVIRKNKILNNQVIQNNIINQYFFSILFYKFRRNIECNYFKVY